MGFLPGRGGAPWALAMAIALAPSCHEIDTERQTGPKGTLGDDMYGLMCDRLGASVLSEDLTGESYHSICHYDDEGRYGNDVDQSVLPPVKGEKAERARTLSLAKMHRMAIVRSQLVRAFNAAFPDVKVADPTTEDPDDTVRLHDALLQFSQDITLLYDDNPFAEGGEPVMPMMTDAFGRLFRALEESDDARAALERIAGRQGYRPFPVGLGAIRTLLAYPEMRSFIRAKMEVLGPNGTAVPELQQLLVTVKRELESSVPTLTDLPPYEVGPGAQPNRPRSALEVGRALLLETHDRFAVHIGEPPRFIAQRDERGLAVPAGNLPGVPGTVAAPFADTDGDGYADVDAQGRFIDASGALLPLDTPFLIPGKPFGEADEYMRPLSAPYQYVDTARTLLGAIARDLVPLVDPNRYASDGDPEPWKSENETLMYALAGMHLLGGPREPARFDHESETILPAGAPCPSSLCTDYQRFVGETSPIPDLVHAAGQILAHPDSDIIMLGLLELLENHEQVVARVLGAALRVKEIADQHDELAAQGMEEKAELAHEVPVYDEIAQVVSDMAQHPGLIRKLLAALADPTIVQSHSQDPKITGAPAQHLGETLSAFVTFRDRYQYDPQNINSVAYNETDGWPSYANPHNPVDRSQPLAGENRSMFERALQAIYDASGIRACNKPGAKVYTGIGDIYWPLAGTYDECELFSFADVGAFYLDAQLPSNHPKRAELVIQATDMQALLSFVGTFTSIDAFLQSTSGITGLTLHPEPNALHRLLFYGSNSTQFGQLPDYDTVNAGSKTDKFVSSSLEPLGAVVCPKNSLGVPHCSSSSDVLRMRDFGSIFAWERLGFTQYLKPQLKVFAEVSCNATISSCDTEDFTGESYFLRLIGALWRHWPGADHGSYCDSNASSPRYCSGAGINRYEPILAEAFLTDLIPALHEFAKVATSVNITIERGPRAGQTVNGGEIIELLVKLLFDQQYAASVGMTDRQGNASTAWTDGTPQAQLTPYSMFADALRRMDLTFDESGDAGAAERKSKWKRARSLLVDQFLHVESTGPDAHFANQATPRALITAIRLLREQLNANCSDRENSGECEWAAHVLADKLSDTLSRPVFAGIADVTDKLNQHEPARRELERFLSYALLSDTGSDALAGMLASLGDLMQLLRADGDFAPIFNAVANAAAPAADPDGPGCADRTIQVLKAMSDDRYDRYHVLDHVLPALVTPMDGGTGLSPVEVILDAIADIHREDSRQHDEPLRTGDYRFVMKTMKDFLLSDFRGFRQLYAIVRNRPKDE